MMIFALISFGITYYVIILFFWLIIWLQYTWSINHRFYVEQPGGYYYSSNMIFGLYTNQENHIKQLMCLFQDCLMTQNLSKYLMKQQTLVCFCYNLISCKMFLITSTKVKCELFVMQHNIKNLGMPFVVQNGILY